MRYLCRKCNPYIGAANRITLRFRFSKNVAVVLGRGSQSLHYVEAAIGETRLYLGDSAAYAPDTSPQETRQQKIREGVLHSIC